MKGTRLKTIVSLIVAVVVIIAGAWLIKAKKAAMESVPPAKTYGMVVPVKTASLSKVTLTVPYLAEVKSDTDVKIASKVTSRVEKIIPSGTRVRKGDLLVRLDSGELQAKKEGLQLKIKEVNNQIRAKQADLESVQHTHKRNRKLLDIQAVSREQFESESSKIESLKATIAGMKNNAEALAKNIEEIEDTLSYTTIKSPMDGIVSETYVAEGGISAGGKPLLSLSGGDHKRLIVRVSDNVKPTALIQSGEPCPLVSLNSTYKGLDEYSCNTRTDLAAGNRVEVKLVVYQGETILLPSNAVLQRGGSQVVLVVKGDQAMPKPVTILAEGSEGLVVEGVVPGDEYVIAKPDVLLKLLTGVSVIKAGS